VTPGLVLQAAPRPPRAEGRDMRVGFTASRKVGNAVVRNRAKRRLRAAASQLLTAHGNPQTDYVLIARATTAGRTYAALLDDLKSALRRVETGSPRRRPRATPKE
jgi:ribonuclease P protein component